ncbi:hypothetical protein ACIBEH_12575 [Nocardia salmonicida]|uniref:hypothetical protein n=1 Tax=Nocardia salmonicida TaxID=53431 RepID=UPI0037AAEC56
MKMIVRTTAATLAITATLTCGTATAQTGDYVAPDSGSALLAPLSLLAALLQSGECGSSCGADATAAPDAGSSAPINSTMCAVLGVSSEHNIFCTGPIIG